MPRCALLTTDNLEGYVTDDDLVREPLARRGWDTEYVSWRAPGTDWDAFDVVVVRTPWDYPTEPEAFFACLSRIAASRALLRNPLATARWNMVKTYLRDLAARGVPCVPVRFVDRDPAAVVDESFAAFETAELVVKPLIGASASHTHRVPASMPAGERHELLRELADRPSMIQPFLPAVLEHGEVSLVYLGGEFSHAVRKTPRAGDFRSQEEHGARIDAVAADADLLAAAGRAMGAAPGDDLLYARADFVRHDGRWLLMELELIEPALYLRMDPAAPDRFAAAIEATAAARPHA